MNAPLRQGPSMPASVATFKEKYCQQGEGFREVCNRVAFALSDGPEHYHRLRGIALDMRFLFGGRIYSNMGTTKATTPYNCFVSGTVADSFVDGPGCIMQRATEAAATMRMGGGIGYDFSTLRPYGSLVTKLQSYSSGPVSFMRIFNEIGICVSSSGHRRGAQMGMIRVDHPDIEQFILAKQNTNQMNGFNLSVAVTDAFMNAVANDKQFDLVFEGRVYRTIRARDLWERIMRSTWDWAEPGVIFIDRINKENNLAYCEIISATNPCAEQPLPPYGACLLGSFNITGYLKPGSSGWELDKHTLAADIPVIVRALDNVVDRALYPLKAHMDEALSKRRMGIGVTGVANALEAMGLPYGSIEFVAELKEVLAIVRDCSYMSSAMIAREKGAFPLFHKDRYLASPFIMRMSKIVRDAIAENGIRNSHLISIAPTGTISFCADNISSGIEPVFAHRYSRKVRTAAGYETYDVEDYGVARLGIRGRTADEVSAIEHVEVLTAAQEFVDSSISKTCNIGPTVEWDDFKGIYMEAWKRGAKGCSTHRADGKRGGVMEKKCDGDTCSQ